MNPNTQVFVYHGPRRFEFYNQFFNPNICHVCKAVDNGNMILCDKCGLISYCNNKHKMLHYTEHGYICGILASVLKEKLQNNTCTLASWQGWYDRRKNIMDFTNVTYSLDLYEKQMIMWSKTCVICYQQANLQVCQKCFSANFCNEHAEVFHLHHHDTTCELLTRLLNINIETISGRVTDISYEFLSRVKEDTRVNEMLEFYMKCILISRDDVNWLVEDYVLSDYLSGPLSIYYSFEKIYSDKTYNVLHQKFVIIHIIVENPVNRHSLPAWEVLLHLIPEIEELIIMMVGPKVDMVQYEHNPCYDCQKNRKKIKFYPIYMFYHDYIRISKSYQIPDLIVGFEIKLDDSNIWSESLKVIQNCDCPFILSATCEEEVHQNMMAIHSGLNMNVIFKYKENFKNYFAGLAPHKHLTSGIIYFRNQYLIIFPDLKNNNGDDYDDYDNE